jgi:alkanesulfonate monooxygenase SsuD/methylene tetrahydromethanopterin reductase-like flavin-dependent oxidoreductase (luciferase family)
VATVQHAERLGFDEAWVTEYHFNRFSVSASISPLLAHLAGVTSTIRLGSAAVLLPMHDIRRVAEDAATVDALSDGRLMLGVARGAEAVCERVRPLL